MQGKGGTLPRDYRQAGRGCRSNRSLYRESFLRKIRRQRNLSRKIVGMLVLAVFVLSCIVCSAAQATGGEATSSVALSELDAIAKYHGMPSIFISTLEGNFEDFFKKATVPGRIITISISTDRAEMFKGSLNIFGGVFANPEDRDVGKFLVTSFHVPKTSRQGLTNYQKLLIGSMKIWEV